MELVVVDVGELVDDVEVVELKVELVVDVGKACDVLDKLVDVNELLKDVAGLLEVELVVFKAVDDEVVPKVVELSPLEGSHEQKVLPNALKSEIILDILTIE